MRLRALPIFGLSIGAGLLLGSLLQQETEKISEENRPIVLAAIIVIEMATAEENCEKLTQALKVYRGSGRHLQGYNSAYFFERTMIQRDLCKVARVRNLAISK